MFFLADLPSPPEKIAVVRASRLGDYLCATPALRALRAGVPGAHITLIALPLVRPLARRSPRFDACRRFPGYPGIAEQLIRPRYSRAFFRSMRAEGFDLVVQLHGSGVNANPFCLNLGGRHTVGFRRAQDRGEGLALSVVMPETGHEIDRVLTLVEALGLPSRGRATELPLRPEDGMRAGRLLRAAGLLPRTLHQGPPPILIGMQLGARDFGKRWPPEHAARVLVELHAEARAAGREVRAVVIGSREEACLVAPFARALRDRVPWVNLMGRTDVVAAAAVVARLDLLLCNDSAPAHFAYALGTPSVTLFLETDPERWGPPEAGPGPRGAGTAPDSGLHRVVDLRPGAPGGVDDVVAACAAALAVRSAPDLARSRPDRGFTAGSGSKYRTAK